MTQQRVRRTAAPCVECGRQSNKRRRGLCWRCQQDPVILNKYPSGVRRGISQGGHDLATPASVAPGTEEKVRVFEDRAARGLALFHPLDASHETAEAARLTP